MLFIINYKLCKAGVLIKAYMSIFSKKMTFYFTMANRFLHKFSKQIHSKNYQLKIFKTTKQKQFLHQNHTIIIIKIIPEFYIVFLIN